MKAKRKIRWLDEWMKEWVCITWKTDKTKSLKEIKK
jgi:hypothetical protein